MGKPTLYPDAVCRSAYDIDYEGLYSSGTRGLIFDIDNTLVTDGAPADERSISLLNKLRDLGFRIVLLSNNNEGRVRPFAEATDTQYICKAGKPGTHGYEAAMYMMGTAEDSTVLVGDQIFTDIWGAGRSGITSYLVGRMGRKEPIQVHLKRVLEALVYWFYKHSRYYICL